MRLPDDCRAIIAGFIQHRVTDAGANGVVLGLSGGIDSAPALAIAVEARGAERVHGLLLPHGDTVSTGMAAAHAAALTIETRELDSAPLAAAFGDAAPFFESREVQGVQEATARRIF